MSRSIVRTLACLIAGMFLVATGCKSKTIEVAPVQGIVTLDGKPLEGIEVHFVPDGEKGTEGPRAIGTTDAKGQFALTCGDRGSGAVVGHHRVMLVDTWAQPPVPDRREGKAAAPRKVLDRPRISDVYSQVTTTPLRREVAAGGSPSVELKIVSTP